MLREHRHQLTLPDELRDLREDRQFAEFQKKTRCLFFVWGTLVERKDAQLGGKSALILRTDALVVHSQIAQFRRKILGGQFQWPKEIKIDEDAEYQGLQFTADELVLVADLVIGSAAAMVGNALPALEIHEKLLSHLKKLPRTPPRAAIQKHVTAMIVDELSVLATVAYIDADDPHLAKGYLNRAFQLKPNHHNSLVILARIQFEFDNDPAAALKTTHKLKPVAEGSGIWRYNVAFLEMFNGNHKESWKMYREIFANSFPDEESTVQQVIKFNDLQFKKGFTPSLFIIATLFFRKLGNLPESLRYFEAFLAEAENRSGLTYLASLASEQRHEIMETMKLTE